MNITGNVVKAPPLQAPSTVKSESSALEKSMKIHSSLTFCHPNTPRNGRRSPKHFRICPQPTPMPDPFYHVVKYPLFTEATMRDMEEKNTLVIIVDVRADKSEIKAVVQDMLGIKVKRVNTLIRSDGKKKAFVQLTQDHSAADALRAIGKHSVSFSYNCNLELELAAALSSPALS